MIRFILGLVALALAGCASLPVPLGGHVATDGGLPGITGPTVVGWLTDNQPAQGSPWVKMNPNGYTGSLKEACKLLGVDEVTCKTKVWDVHQAGGGKVVEIENGVVLRGLTFTRGTHRVQKHVLVDLINPSSRLAEVFDLGGGRYLLRFHGCGNYALIVTEEKPVTPTVPPTTTGDICIFVDSVEPSFVKMRLGKSLTSEILFERANLSWKKTVAGRYVAQFCYPRRLKSTPGGTTLCSLKENNYLSGATMSYIDRNDGIGRDVPAVLAP